jgi:rhodanese-related sulfurtransferase
MKESFFPKEVLVVLIGVLLIIAVLLITIVFPKKESQPIPSKNFSEDSKTTRFFEQVTYVQAETLQQEISRKNILVLDLRERSYYDISRIANSLSVTPDTVVDTFKNYKPTPTEVVLLDTEGQTEALQKAIQSLRENNIKNIRVLSGGYSTWNTLIYPTISYADPESALDHSKVRSISIENAKKLLTDKQVIFLDVRPEGDYTNDHKEGSINIPFELLETSREKIPKTKMLIVYGTSPLDSFQAGVRLFDLGYNLAYTVVGGYIDLK